MDLQRLKKTLIRHEGFRSKPYLCTAGKRTIGIGRNLDDVGLSPAERAALGIGRTKRLEDGISMAEAEYLLDNDIAKVTRGLDAHIPWWRSLSSVRQEVLVNMGFNLGLRGLLGFKATLEAIRQGQYEHAAERMMRSLWAKQVGRRAKELADAMKLDRFREER
jgi:lysozyme